MEAPNPTPEVHHHRSARERQRRGPMWGCLRWIVFAAAGVLLLLFITIGGGVAVEKWGEQKGTWSHVPLRQATQQDISDVLAARYQTEDEEIARSLAGYGS